MALADPSGSLDSSDAGAARQSSHIDVCRVGMSLPDTDGGHTTAAPLPTPHRASRPTHLWLAVVLTLLLPIAWLAAADAPPATQPAAKFVTMDVYVDSGDKALAAWQVELKATKGDVQIVGVEGGEQKNVYRDPPYYDPAALSGGRIVLASYTTAQSPPKGKLLVARVHLRTVGEYELGTRVITAADPAAKPIEASSSAAKE